MSSVRTIQRFPFLLVLIASLWIKSNLQAQNASQAEPGDASSISGLGTEIGAEGLVLTKASQITSSPDVRMSKDRVLSARVVGVNPAYDLALLKVDGLKCPPLTWSKQLDPAAGTFLMAPSNTGVPIAAGIVSVRRRNVAGSYPDQISLAPLPDEKPAYGPVDTIVGIRRGGFPIMLECDLPMTADECGGPVLGLDGSVLGIVIARIGAYGSAVIPPDVIEELLPQLSAGKPLNSMPDRKDENIEVAGIGVAVDVQDDRCLVRAVLPDSPADKLGTPRVGDRILAVAEVDGEPVSVKGKPLAGVVTMVRGQKGTTVRLTIVPKGKMEDDRCVVSLVRGSVKILDTIGDGKLLKPNTEIPDFAYVRLDNDAKGRIRDHAGKIVVLDFWASWCAPCIQSLDKSQALLEKHPEWRDKVDFIAVSVDEEQGNAARTFEGRKWKGMTVVWAGPDVMKSYHLNSMPTVYLVGPDGRVKSVDQRLDLKIILRSDQ